MARATLILQVHVRWWLRLYLSGVELASQLTGMSPNWNKIERAVERGTMIKKVNK